VDAGEERASDGGGKRAEQWQLMGWFSHGFFMNTTFESKLKILET
jgi:hypothetical protein